jgi:hypothetical protein
MSDKEVIGSLYEDYCKGVITLDQFLDRVATLSPDAISDGFRALQKCVETRPEHWDRPEGEVT